MKPFIETVKERAAEDEQFRDELLNELLGESKENHSVLYKITRLCNEKI